MLLVFIKKTSSGGMQNNMTKKENYSPQIDDIEDSKIENNFNPQIQNSDITRMCTVWVIILFAVATLAFLLGFIFLMAAIPELRIQHSYVKVGCKIQSIDNIYHEHKCDKWSVCFPCWQPNIYAAYDYNGFTVNGNGKINYYSDCFEDPNQALAWIAGQPVNSTRHCYYNSRMIGEFLMDINMSKQTGWSFGACFLIMLLMGVAIIMALCFYLAAVIPPPYHTINNFS